jgi:hypothetical protein
MLHCLTIMDAFIIEYFVIPIRIKTLIEVTFRTYIVHKTKVRNLHYE